MACDRDRLAAAGVSVLAVAHAKPDVLRRVLARQNYPFPVVSDPDRVAYRAFALGRVSWLHFLMPWVLLSYLWLILRGRAVRLPAGGEDVLQLGGDFVLDRQRRLVFAHPSRGANDRPPVAAILRDLRR